MSQRHLKLARRRRGPQSVRGCAQPRQAWICQAAAQGCSSYVVRHSAAGSAVGFAI